MRWLAGLSFAAACAAPCKVEGEGYDLKVGVEGPCCDGLVAANTALAPDTDGACVEEDLNPAKVCLACGDGTCGRAENTCNCPLDCPP